MKRWLPLLRIGAVFWAAGLMTGFVYFRGGGAATRARQPEPLDTAALDDSTVLPGSKAGVFAISELSDSPPATLAKAPFAIPVQSWRDGNRFEADGNATSSAVESALADLRSRVRPQVLLPSSKSGLVDSEFAREFAQSAPKLDEQQLEAPSVVLQSRPSTPAKAPTDAKPLRPDREGTLMLSSSKSFSGPIVVSSGALRTSNDPIRDPREGSDVVRSVAANPSPSPAPLRPERTVVLPSSKLSTSIIRSEDVSPPDPVEYAREIAIAARSITVVAPSDVAAARTDEAPIAFEPKNLFSQFAATPVVQQANPNAPPPIEAKLLRPERTMVLSGSKSYFGQTTVSSGTLAVRESASGEKSIVETAAAPEYPNSGPLASIHSSSESSVDRVPVDTAPQNPDSFRSPFTLQAKLRQAEASPQPFNWHGFSDSK